MPKGGTNSHEWKHTMLVGQTPEPAFLHEILRYDAQTGKLFWLWRPVEMFTDGQQTAEHVAARWNSRCAGKEALSNVMARGYLGGKIFGHIHYAHRVIWAMQAGEWPVGFLDHKDTNKSNNRWENLRPATVWQNAWNKGISSRNKSGFKGVSLDKRIGKWVASITAHGKHIYLGAFDSSQSAAERVNSERFVLHAEFGRSV